MAPPLPSELWRRILQHACTVPRTLDTPLRIGGNIDEIHDLTASLQDLAKSRRATHKCVALVDRTWHSLSAEFFWTYLVLDSRSKVIGAATALYASAHNQNVPNPNRFPLYPRGTGGLGWFIHRIDMEFDLCATGTIDEDPLRALVYILKSSPNLQVYSDISDSETPRPYRLPPLLTDAIMPLLLPPKNSIRRIDWHSNNLLSFCCHLHNAQSLQLVNLRYFDDRLKNPPSDRALYVHLPKLHSITFREHGSLGQAAIASTWDLPSLRMLTVETAQDFGSHPFLLKHGPSIRHLSLHTPTIGGPFPPIAAYCSFTPQLETLHFQLHQPTFALGGTLPTLKMVGIHGLLQWGDRDFDDGEPEMLHNHLTAMVRSKQKMPSLHSVRLVDFDPESWQSMYREASEVARWQRWQIRWESLGVRFEDHKGELMRIPQDLLELLEMRDLAEDSYDEETEMEDDYEWDGSSIGGSLGSSMISWGL
jgi:hypothetical protein